MNQTVKWRPLIAQATFDHKRDRTGFVSPFEYPFIIMAQRKPPDSIISLAESCVQAVQENLSFELDYTIDTLPVVDHHCRMARQGEHWPHSAELLAQTVGAYFGEVIRRHFKDGCRWVLTADGPHAWRLEFEDCFLCFNPVGAALELLLEGSAHGWNADFVTLPEVEGALEEHLDQLPGVSERDFYTLSVRYEVLETIQDFLERWRVRKKKAPRRYETAEYERRLAQMHPDLAVELNNDG
jgi:hypothetical protein